MEQDAGALDMAEEAVADPGAFGGAFDQPGNVGDDELAALVADHAELRAERREGIVADFGGGVGDGVEEGRFAGVRKADEADVGEQLEPQPQPQFLAVLAGLVLARGAIGRGLVAGVAAAAEPAREHGHALTFVGQVREQGAFLVVGEDLGPDRDLDDQIGAAGACAVGARAALAARGAEMLGVAKVDQRIEAGDRLEHDVAALAAVAAVGPAELDELLAPERDRAGAAGAGASRRSWPGRGNASRRVRGSGADLPPQGRLIAAAPS